MSSVTQRIKEIKQPYGGYLKPSEFEKIKFEDNKELNEENISPSLVGLAVDYLTRFMLGKNLSEAFKISLLGADIINDLSTARRLLNKIDGLNDKSIISACKLVGYDVCFRAGPIGYKDIKNINPDKQTINNIVIMVNRSLSFFEHYGPMIKDGFTFEGGYTDTINAGDGDFLTEDTLWDFKVSSRNPKSSHTLQLLIYYIMGINSINQEFKSIKKIGIFNPRLNTVYIKKIEDIPQNIIDEVSKDVIGYNRFTNIDENVKEINIIKEDLDMSEIMRILQCTRYMVMKYYAEEGLPLYKNKNKYYISREELYDWIEEKEERERIINYILIFTIIFFIALIVICCKVLL